MSLSFSRLCYHNKSHILVGGYLLNKLLKFPGGYLKDFITCYVGFIYIYYYFIYAAYFLQRRVSGIAFTLTCVIYVPVNHIQWSRKTFFSWQFWTFRRQTAWRWGQRERENYNGEGNYKERGRKLNFTHQVLDVSGRSCPSTLLRRRNSDRKRREKKSRKVSGRGAKGWCWKDVRQWKHEGNKREKMM